MLYNLLVKVITHPAFHHPAEAVKIVVAHSNVPKNLKQYYADRLMLLIVASK